MSFELRRVLNDRLPRSLAAALLCLFLSVYPFAIASANDRTDVQAAITGAETAQGYTNQGIFDSMIFIEHYPYAWVSVALGVKGYGSMDYILSKAAGSWKILGQGGGVLGVSEMIGFGVPVATAKSLEGSACPGRRLYFAGYSRPPPALDTFSGHVHVIRHSVSLALYRLVAAKGPAVLPAHKTFAVYKGRRIAVSVVMPLYLYACTL
jgi:hypothetical protein